MRKHLGACKTRHRGVEALAIVHMHQFLLSLFALIAQPTDTSLGKIDPAQAGVTVGPRGDIRGLVRHEDYPPEALAKGEQGTVQVKVTVDEQGRVAACEIERSSESPALDARTCTIISERAKFEPARDNLGRPTAGTIQQRITWRIEESTMPAQDWGLRAIATYHPDGRVTCSGELMGALKSVAPDDSDCGEAQATSDELRGAGIVRPGETTIVTEERHFIRGRVAPSALPRPPPGDVLILRQILELSIAADGKLTSCREVAFEGAAKKLGPPCAHVNPFDPPISGLGKPMAIDATMVISVSFRFAQTQAEQNLTGATVPRSPSADLPHVT